MPGKCRLEKSVIDIPFIITWAAMSIANGTLVLLVSLAAIAIAAAQLRSMAVPFAALSFFCYVVQLAFYATTQVSENCCSYTTFQESFLQISHFSRFQRPFVL